MNFFVDMPLSPELAAWLRDAGHNAVHASDIGMYKATDREILDAAASQARVVITADLDFPRLLASLGLAEPGLILLRGGNFTEAESLECVRRVLRALPEADLPKLIVVVDPHKIRRRWLPV